MKDYWMKFGCFLCGYNYDLVQRSSERIRIIVKRNLSALLMVIPLWAYIGFYLSTEYLKTSNGTGAIVSIVCVFIIIQFERIIILTDKRKGFLKTFLFRLAIGLCIAFIGAVIIDQKLFHEDIQIEKQLADNTKRIDEATQTERDSITKLIYLNEKKIQSSNEIIKSLINEEAVINVLNNETILKKDSVRGEYYVQLQNNKSYNNPKLESLETHNKLVNDLTAINIELNKKRDTLLADGQKKYKSKKGIIDELELLHKVVTKSWIGIVVYLSFFFLFLGIELFVLLNKASEEDNDYEELIRFQERIRKHQLQNLTP